MLHRKWYLLCVFALAGCSGESGPFPALSPPAAGKADENGLVTQIRPQLRRVAEGDALRVVLHWEDDKGPIKWPSALTVSWHDTLDSLTFHVTTPDGKKLELKPEPRKKTSDYPANLSQSPTLFLALTASGFRCDPGDRTATWQDGPVPALDSVGKYTISVSGQLMPAEKERGKGKGKPIAFASESVDVERVEGYKTIDEIRTIARARIKHKLKAGTEQGGYVYDDADGNRLVHLTGPEEEMWHYTAYTVQISPEGKVTNLFARKVPNCLAAGTLVQAEGGEVRIEDVRVGDRVWGYDLGRGERVLTSVRAVRRAEASETLRLGCGLRVTGGHPVYASGGWKMARELSERDELLGTDGETVRVGKIERVRGRVVVYDLTVDEPHDFFADGVLVHNKSRAYTPQLDDLWYRLWSPQGK